jgi:7-cyano-7-deazaguanine synthase
MDSTTALYRALNQSEVRAVITFEYDQRGATHEVKAARNIFEQLSEGEYSIEQDWDNMDFLVSRFEMNAVSALFNNSFMSPDPDTRHFRKFNQEPLPATFVPARNLIMLSIAASSAWTLNCEQIWGGWSGVDVEYPDCNPLFLSMAEDAINASLGLYNQDPRIHIMAPLVNMSKTESVLLGDEMGVPWSLTRSCYRSGKHPCLRCDSCLLRIKAFVEAGVSDTSVAPRVWNTLRDAYREV